jgi:diguanylate cyclase (GGDEF)-like protein
MAANPKPLPEDGPLRDLLVFHNVARSLTSSLDRDSILKAIMQQMERFFQPETWTLLLVDEEKKDLHYAVAVGNGAEQLTNVRIKLGQGIAGWVAEHGETLIVPELGLDPRFDSDVEARAVGMRSAICIPLRSRSRTLGVVQLFNCRLETLTEYSISFLHVLCDYAAIAIENARSVERIQELTITDDCTGLFNVRHLYTMLGKEIERARRFSSEFSLIFIDLDHFKEVNDKYGHLVGSRLLAEVGHRVRSQVRAVDSTFRYGGDEFVVLLPGTRKQEATQTAQRLWRSIRAGDYLSSEKLSLRITASLGVATFPDDGYSIHEVIGAADETMYKVKNAQRDSVGVSGIPLTPKPTVVR